MGNEITFQEAIQIINEGAKIVVENFDKRFIANQSSMFGLKFINNAKFYKYNN